MDTIEVAKQEYKTADEKGKLLLEKVFGKEQFLPKVEECIKSYEDACNDQGLDPDKNLPYDRNTKDPEEQVSNHHKILRTIAKSLKRGHELDFGNSDQEKWFPRFEWDKSCSRFVFWASDYTYTGTDTIAGSRLSFHTQELSDYFGKQFIDSHNVVQTQ